MYKGNWWVDVLLSFLDKEVEAMRFPECCQYSLLKQKFQLPRYCFSSHLVMKYQLRPTEFYDFEKVQVELNPSW